jgi:hypothetical protein
MGLKGKGKEKKKENMRHLFSAIGVISNGSC